jgi:phosphoribosylformylglycinamidine synthase subunit PurS
VKARVIVRPRREILDPQGKAIRAALERIGFDGVVDVRAGKSFDIEFAAADETAARARLKAMCDGLLVNPVVEDFEFELLEHGDPRS